MEERVKFAQKGIMFFMQLHGQIINQLTGPLSCILLLCFQNKNV